MSTKVYVLAHEVARLMGASGAEGYGWAVVRDVDGDGEPDVVHTYLVDNPEHFAPPWLIPFFWSKGEIPLDHSARGHTHCVRVCLEQFTTDSSARQAEITWNGSTKTADLVALDIERDPFARTAPILENVELKDKLVLCIGLGSGGSAVVNDLARSGVGRFILWDNDRLEAHNVGRHVCTLRDIGRLKVKAVSDHITSINPLARVETITDDVMEHREPGGLLERSVKRADYVLVGTDNNKSRFAINRAAWQHQKSAIYGRVYHRACGGDVIHVLPTSSMPCYECHIGDADVHEEISSPRNAAELSYSDLPVHAEPGLNLDIGPVANHMARLIILNLCKDKQSKLAPVAEELSAPRYFWVNRREMNFSEWAPMGRTFQTLSILRWYGTTVKQNPECSVCGLSE